MSSDLRTLVIRLAHENPSLRPHLLPLLKEASGPEGKGTLVAENNGTRTVWKKGVTAKEAAALIAEWDSLMNAAEGGDKDAKKKLRAIPLKEGGDALFVEAGEQAWLYADGDWEEN